MFLFWRVFTFPNEIKVARGSQSEVDKALIWAPEFRYTNQRWLGLPKFLAYPWSHYNGSGLIFVDFNFLSTP